MNKFILIAAVTMLSVISFAQTEATKISEITFGRYGSDCSSGRGACSFAVSKSAISRQGRKGSRKLSDTVFIMEINRRVLSAKDEISIAGTRFSEINPHDTPDFIQLDPLLLDGKSLENLQVNPKYNTIKPGIYPMRIYENTIEIVFTLSSG